MQSISAITPSHTINRENVIIPFKLADPDFYQTALIQMLIGAGPTLSFLNVGQIRLPMDNDSDLVLQKTQLGWVIGENTPNHKSQQRPNHEAHNLQIEVEKFWELENVNRKPYLAAGEQAAKSFFKTNTTRTPNGRYVVALPFKESPNTLRDSQRTVLRRFYFLEAKLNKDRDLIKLIKELDSCNIATSRLKSTIWRNLAG